MKSTELVTEQLFKELMDVFFDKFIFYVRSEVVIEKVVESLGDDFDRGLLDVFLYTDNELGISGFNNEDVLELNTYLYGKRVLLQQNTFKLLDKSKELTDIEFLVVVEKYYELLLLFVHLSDWMCVNLKKYNGENINFGIIGAFSIQLNFFISHLKDVCNYFGAFLDLDLEFDFSKQSFVLRYLPEILSRYIVISKSTINSLEKQNFEENKVEAETDLIKNSGNKPNPKKKKQQPEIDEKKIEAMILSQVFKVKETILYQNES